MEKEKQIFKLSDESANSHGFVVKTEGIDVQRFMSNPVMLYNHDYSKHIGLWKNIKIENGVLYGEPDFDEEDEESKKIQSKVERGYVKGVSIGIHFNPDNISIEDDTIVLQKSELLEASICTIPSNKNALKLYNQKGIEINKNEIEEIINLKMNTKMENKEMKIEATQLYLQLNVKDEKEALGRIVELQKSEQKLKEIESKAKKEKEELSENKISQAVKLGQIALEDVEKYKKLAETDMELFVSVMSKIGEQTKRMSEMTQHTKAEQEYKSFDEWRKKDPRGLIKLKVENKQEYDRLIK